MVKRFVIAFVLVALVCGGLVGFNLFRSKAIADYFANQQVPAATISAARVEPVAWSPAIEAIGTLFAVEGVDVAAPIAGVVKSIEFRANDKIEAGQLLVQIDDAVERADLLSAQAAVQRDRAALDRAETLSRRGVSSDASLQDVQTALATSESALARIEATIDLKAIDAPFAGTIGIPRIDVGEYVQPGTMIATLQQLGTMHVDFTVPEQWVDDLKLDQPASFGFTEDAYPYKGRIAGVDPKIDPQTRLIAVRAEVENPGELRPGQFVRVRVQLPQVENVIAVPQTGVVTSLYGDYVYRVEPDDAEGAPQENGERRLVAKQVFVTIGRRQGDLVEITKGIEPGQTIVTSGQNKLSNNMPVKVDNAIDPAAIAFGERRPPS